MARKKAKTNLGFKYEHKRIKREIKLPAICKDYESVTYSANCKNAKLCKNATYNTEGKAQGVCFGGTDPEEHENKKKRLIKV